MTEKQEPITRPRKPAPAGVPVSSPLPVTIRSPKTPLLFTMRARLIATLVLGALLLVSLMTFLNNRSLRQNLTRAAYLTLRSAASQAATSMDAYLSATMDSLSAVAHLPAFRAYLSLPTDQRAGSLQEQQVRDLLNSLQSREKTLSYSLLNRKGEVLLDTSVQETSRLRRFLGLDIVDPQRFTEALDAGQAYVSPVLFSPTGGAPNIFFAAPVKDGNGGVAGMLVSRLDASLLQEQVVKTGKLLGPGSYAILLDENNLRIGQGKNPSLLYKTVTPLDPGLVKNLKEAGRLPDLPDSQLSTNLPGFKTGLRESDRQPYFQTPEGDPEGESNLVAVARLQSQPWSVAYLQPQSIILAPVKQQIRAALFLAILISVVAAGFATIVASFLTNPITELTRVAERVTAGDLQAQVRINSSDEIGVLAGAFNTMTRQLQRTLHGLEQRVSERTRDLERRAVQFQVTAEVARQAAAIRDLENLLQDAVRLISARFNFYHAGIFLLDEARQYAILRAASSTGGQTMLAHKHKLKVGQTGIVGFVAEKGEPRIALDVGEDAVYFNNPDLPETRSEAALPLIARDQVIGVLDVQSTQAQAFSQEDLGILQILADQIALAIDNARLFAESRQALNELQTMYRQQVRHAWQKELVEGPVAFGYDSLGIVPASSLTPSPEGHTLQVPIQLRGQKLGSLFLRREAETGVWTKEERELVEKTTNQVALALENARLLKEAQNLAQREQKINSISSQMRSSVNMDTILQNTIRELGKALGATRTFIQIGSEAELNPGQSNQAIAAPAQLAEALNESSLNPEE